MDKLDLIFNFIGVCVVEWQPAFRFFHETLGIRAKLEPKFGDWAIFGGAWDAYYNEGSRSAIFELFDRGRPVTERRWGVNQGIRPGFHVSSLQGPLEKLDLPMALEEHPWGRTAEFSTPEGIRFAFAENPDAPFSNDLSLPYIGHVAIKCADFEAMQAFYGDVLGFRRTKAASDYGVFSQRDGYPFIVLEPGGSASTFDLRNTPWQDNAVRAFPVFISLMTSDIQTVYEHLKSRNVKILRDVISNEDWGGTDLHIADPDGNGIQVVQYR